MLRNDIKQSKKQCWKALRADGDQDPWGMPYRQVMRKITTNRCTDSTEDCSSAVPKWSGQRKLPERCGTHVPLFQIGELKLVAKRLES